MPEHRYDRADFAGYGTQEAEHAEANGQASGQRFESPFTGDVPDLIELARRAKNGEKFRALFDRGDWQSQGYPSRSEADLALCCMLVWWLDRDPDRVDAAFRQSGMYRVHSKRWDRQDYRERTIKRALEQVKGCYQDGGGDVPSKGKARKAARSKGRTGYAIILAFWQDYYDPIFRRGGKLYSRKLGRDVTMSEATAGAPMALIDELEGAEDAPCYAKSRVVNRDALPAFFGRWCKSAWMDLLASRPDEERCSEVDATARAAFRLAVCKALHALVALGWTRERGVQGNDKQGDDKMDIQRRSLYAWCRSFAKLGQWAQVRSYLLWCRRDPGPNGAPGPLRVALRLELFSEVAAPAVLQNITATAFTQLCELYDVGSPVRVRGGQTRGVELTADFLAEVEALTDGHFEDAGENPGTDGKKCPGSDAPGSCAQNDTP